ncbi:glycogen synthase GlgA [Rhodobacteraceae bacterium HSP-20]|uniref:Glycogen synthase n=1 Tax=Paragemmobacter amnigenus TaxID=2852097 RepID=A0ABS6J4P5_9RHOB|nr:glycogen synthase GlgA [Rhodobacter amnigenus]MBU9698500.1 glycogen synthase GlgA [Rhodobacter amnigenus]MBV4389727.1 glycogen synthase GlgA [Rhodobacter amnigenus]
MQVKGRVLSVASECVPLIKTGGLADVVGALPAALRPFGWEMRVLLPAYRRLRGHLAAMREVWREPALWGGEGVVYAGTVEGVEVLLLDAPHLYDRDGGPYNASAGDWPDNAQRFAALSWVAARMAREGFDGWKPDVLHAHDWQAGFAPAYLAYGGTGGVGSVITVHNIAFQGWAEATLIDTLRLPRAAFHPGHLEYYGGLSSLKAGLVTADRITTVSPSYAAELTRAEYGMGLQGVIAARGAVVSGILNGVDTALWSPELEPVPFGPKAMKGKTANRAALCAEFGMAEPEGPLAIVVSRLTDQKGIDLLPAVIPDFVAAGGALIVLGSGDPALESAMRGLESRFPGRVAVRIGYDEGLSHRLFAGADAVLVPSRFEPCGLTQMYGLRYGTIPVVAAVGGLADTVIHASPAALAAGVATGVQFHPTDALAFAHALRQLCALYRDRKVWARLQRNAMSHPVGWETSAAAYAALYEGLGK